jgi:ligand-binding SRPBCC domain-containing protein
VKVYSLVRKQRLQYPREYVFSFFKSPENLAYITPDSLGFKILTPSPVAMQVGTLIDYTIRWLGIRLRWRTLITTYEPPFSFVDEQIKGPYSFWHHTHIFEECAEGTEMVDEVKYALPLGVAGEIIHELFVRRQLNGIFDYRAGVIEKILARGYSRYLAHVQSLSVHEVVL